MQFLILNHFLLQTKIERNIYNTHLNELEKEYYNNYIYYLRKIVSFYLAVFPSILKNTVTPLSI